MLSPLWWIIIKAVFDLTSNTALREFLMEEYKETYAKCFGFTNVFGTTLWQLFMWYNNEFSPLAAPVYQIWHMWTLICMPKYFKYWYLVINGTSCILERAWDVFEVNWRFPKRCRVHWLEWLADFMISWAVEHNRLVGFLLDKYLACCKILLLHGEGYKNMES